MMQVLGIILVIGGAYLLYMFVSQPKSIPAVASFIVRLVMSILQVLFVVLQVLGKVAIFIFNIIYKFFSAIARWATGKR